VALLPLAVLMGGCVSAEQRQAAQNQLMRAQEAFRRAQADPNVQTYAQLPLIDAQKALEAAQQTSSVPDMQHLGYVAERKAETATIVGQARRMEEDSQDLSRQAAEMVAQKREREAKIARADAEAREREAKIARADAEARARELERARQENVARAQQMERDRMQLEAQARQIEQTRQLAEARAREAEARTREAEARAREVEQARLEAEQKAREAEQARAAALAAQAQSAALSREMAELKAQETERGVVMTLGDVLFATGRAEVAPGAQRSLEKLADFLRNYPTRNVLIEGHTDSTGSQESNLRLSEQRAEAIKTLLVARGVSADRIATKGYGMQYPLVTNDTAEGRQQNRRVEIIVLNEGVAAQGAGR